MNKRQRKKTPYGRGKWHLGEVWDKKFLKTWLAMPEAVFDLIPKTLPSEDRYV